MASRYQAERYPVGAYSFSVIIGNKEIGFSKVGGIDITEKITHRETLSKSKSVQYVYGCETDSEYTKEINTTKNKSLILEKAFMPKANDEQNFIKNYMKVGTQIEQITVKVKDASRNVVLSIEFKDCIVASYSLSDLDAEQTGYITQRILIQYMTIVIN